MGVQFAYTGHDAQNDLDLVRRVRKWRKSRSMRDIARELGVSHGVVQRLAAGKVPKRPEIREALGLKVLAPAPVCSRCGVVHARVCKADFPGRLRVDSLRDRVGILATWYFLRRRHERVQAAVD